MMKTICIAASAILMTATGALAAAPQTDEPAKKEKKVCKSEKITGSLTRVRRTCMTQAEWDRLAEGSREGVEDVVREAGRNVGNSGGGL